MARNGASYSPHNEWDSRAYSPNDEYDSEPELERALVSLQNVSSTNADEIIDAYEPIVQWVTFWTRSRFHCTLDEAFDRMKRGNRQGGLSFSELRACFLDYAMPQEMDLERTTIEDLGIETCRRYLAEAIRISDLMFAEDPSTPVESYETWNIPEDLRNKYVQTVQHMRDQWVGYLQAMRAHCIMDLSMHQPDGTVANLYNRPQTQDMFNMFSDMLVRRLLLRS